MRACIFGASPIAEGRPHLDEYQDRVGAFTVAFFARWPVARIGGGS